MSTDAMIVYLPIDGSWVKEDFPHMTLVYGGPIADLNENDFNTMAKDAISASRLTGTFNLSVTGVEEFGEGVDKVDVLTLYPTPQLLLARKLVEKWSVSEFEFSPHVTVGPVGSAAAIVENTPRYSEGYRRQVLPTKIYFNRIAACWGDKRLIFGIDEMY
jgi:2'-5' RNA ligase